VARSEEGIPNFHYSPPDTVSSRVPWSVCEKWAGGERASGGGPYLVCLGGFS
jgi:hypothetical protein